ncbi:tripartite tricarboxylate transporter substrate binding protein [Candidimonas humi]|uniref:Tripartite tricarboxylate transporter substrate binding protein n=1 Tax=Candidimonas humi TaxID=683355 RepID=A0ABV8NSV6_9BURK|nr:tripartite tricarboxylate transporter substrate binding protein [Candidimonas humi]MBV6303777.1 tripartite tricarboxylate transporter substrate binding protein [Candidimonas humi]
MKLRIIAMIRSAILLLAASLAPMLAQSATHAWPDRRITIVVPFPPGGATDVMARMFAPKIAAALGQPVIVENKIGAGGIVGTQYVAHAPKDGYTLLWGTVATHAIGPSVYKHLPYDPVKDFTPIVHAVDQPYVLVAHPSLNVHTLKELIALAQSRPEAIPAGSAGKGTGAHMILEKFMAQAHVNMLHVPYKGASPAMADLLGGQVKMVFDVVLTTAPYIKSGKLIALAVTSKQRSPTLPDVPTMIEAGVPGFTAVGWNGLFAPAGTPYAVVLKLNKAVDDALASPDIHQRLIQQGSVPVGGTPQEFRQFMQSELSNWRAVAEQAHVSLD